jgi:hypothetical protein
MVQGKCEAWWLSNDLLIIDHDLMQYTMVQIQSRFKVKDNSIGPPSVCIGATLSKDGVSHSRYSVLGWKLGAVGEN